MGNFITYGVTEMLDNDQKFIIDSDRTGPGSITAKDAASSLLSKWAGFETFEEAVQNTISNNQEFIDRDTAIRSKTAELKKKIVTTFTAKDASGAVATFESEFEDAPLKSCIVQVEPVQDLHGYDSPWPGGGGKNLCALNDFTKTKEGVTFAYANGELIVNGTPASTGWFSLRESFRLPAGTYTVSYQVSGSNPVIRVGFDKFGGYIQFVSSGTQSKTFTLTEETNGVIDCYCHQLTAYANTEVLIQIEAGSSATSWSPYSNICPISGWTGCELQRTGKNLIGSAVVHGLWTANGMFYSHEGGRSKYITMNDKMAVKGGETYCLSFVNDPNNVVVSISLNSYHNGEVVQASTYININARIITISEEADEITINFVLTNEITSISDVSITDFKLELGSTATDYEPYTGQTYPITFPTEAGTVYGGQLNVTTGELVVDRAIWQKNTATMNNNEDYPGWSNAGVREIVGGNVSIPYDDQKMNIGKKFAINTHGTNDILFLAIRDYGKTQTEWQALALDVQIVLPLATPIHYPLTPQEIKTLLGQNNIWANTGDTSVEYLMSDVSWYVEKKLRAFQSILAGVEDSETSSKNYSANAYLIFNNDIYRVTKAITTGETIEEGVNVTKTTVAEQLMALAQA